MAYCVPSSVVSTKSSGLYTLPSESSSCTDAPRPYGRLMATTGNASRTRSDPRTRNLRPNGGDGGARRQAVIADAACQASRLIEVHVRRRRYDHHRGIVRGCSGTAQRLIARGERQDAPL